MVEAAHHTVETAKKKFKKNPKIVNFYVAPLQSFIPKEHYYDCVWIQWVALYLTDDDFIKFLQRCERSLLPNGVIVLKENMTGDAQFEVDNDDNSIMRSYRHYEELKK
eukprot:Platyproteum_vivax@DN10264_c0_g1_i1.p1